MAAKVKARSLFDKTILIPAIWDSFRKLDPRLMVRNPVMFVALVGAIVTTATLLTTSWHGGSWGFFLQIALWLWFTVLFANFAEALAEGRGKAQAEADAGRLPMIRTVTGSRIFRKVDVDDFKRRRGVKAQK